MQAEAGGGRAEAARAWAEAVTGEERAEVEEVGEVAWAEEAKAAGVRWARPVIAMPAKGEERWRTPGEGYKRARRKTALYRMGHRKTH